MNDKTNTKLYTAYPVLNEHGYCSSKEIMYAIYFKVFVIQIQAQTYIPQSVTGSKSIFFL